MVAYCSRHGLLFKMETICVFMRTRAAWLGFPRLGTQLCFLNPMSRLCVCVCVCVTSKVSSYRAVFKLNLPFALVEVNVGPPICCFLIIPCYLWKRRVEEYGRSVQQPSFSIYPFTLLAISPSFVKSAVAAGGEFVQNVLPGVSISCREERRRRQQLRRISERGKGNE